MTQPRNSGERLMHRGTPARQLGLFGTAMAVIGGIIGADFHQSYPVAERVHAPALILGAWIAGGLNCAGGRRISEVDP